MTQAYTALADAGWAALEREPLGDGWQARFANGVTKRANSAWPAEDGSTLTPGAMAATETFYRSRGLAPLFQLASADDAAARVLTGRGYRIVDDTLLLAAPVAGSLAVEPGVTISAEPSDEWLDTWWAIDGRGGDAELGVATRILTGTRSLYATLTQSGTVVAVARLALVGSWGGLYCVGTLPEARRRGFGERVVTSVLAAGHDAGATDAWLQVLATNAAARALYARRGFAEVDRYRYFRGLERPLPAAYCR